MEDRTLSRTGKDVTECTMYALHRKTQEKLLDSNVYATYKPSSVRE